MTHIQNDGTPGESRRTGPLGTFEPVPMGLGDAIAHIRTRMHGTIPGRNVTVSPAALITVLAELDQS